MAVVLEGTGLASNLATIRDIRTDREAFQGAVNRIGLFLAVECSKYLPAKDISITTPNETTTCTTVQGNVILVPVLRAGLGLLSSFQSIMPFASIGFIGLRRNEDTLQPEEYYYNIPLSNQQTTFVILDPMLATGGSICATLQSLTKQPHAQVIVASVIAAPEGISTVEQTYPSATVVVAALDRELNSVGYIVPGLGDAGDRLFGTLV